MDESVDGIFEHAGITLREMDLVMGPQHLSVLVQRLVVHTSVQQRIAWVKESRFVSSLLILPPQYKRALCERL